MSCGVLRDVEVGDLVLMVVRVITPESNSPKKLLRDQGRTDPHPKEVRESRPKWGHDGEGR